MTIYGFLGLVCLIIGIIFVGATMLGFALDAKHNIPQRKYPKYTDVEVYYTTDTRRV